MRDVQRGVFVIRDPEPIEAIRFDGGQDSVDAIAALVAPHHGSVRVLPNGPVLVARFPDEEVPVSCGCWIWIDDHGYDRAPASVLDDDEFTRLFKPIEAAL